MKIKPDQNAVTMIQELSDAKAPSGFEDEAVAVAKKYGAEFADVEEDCHAISICVPRIIQVISLFLCLMPTVMRLD